MRKPSAPSVLNAYAIYMICVFLVNLVCYLMVWLKIRRVERNLGATGQSSRQRKYHRIAKVMAFFVMVYLGQYWAFFVFSFWGLFGIPSVGIISCSVAFGNLGGAFNCLAYTLIRRRYQNVGTGETTATVTATNVHTDGRSGPTTTTTQN